MITLKKDLITVDDYLDIRKKVQWKSLSREQAKLALERSLYVVGAYEDDHLIGMGRIVGDGAVICYVQDLIVIPSHQKQGAGSLILKDLIRFVSSIRIDDTEIMLCLMCAKGRESFYMNHGFVARPTDCLGPGMIQYLKSV